MIGRLHTLPVPPGPDRAADPLHHIAQGTMADELRAVLGWVDAVEARAPSDEAVAIRRLRAVAPPMQVTAPPEGFGASRPRPKERHLHRRTDLC
jgi:hypothetical protein